MADAPQETPQETPAEPTQETNPLLEGQEFDEPDNVDVEGNDSGDDPDYSTPDPLETYRQLGFENVESEEDANRRLIESYRQQQADIENLRRQQEEMRTLAQYGNQYLQQMQSPQQQEPQPGNDGWWSPPQVDVGLVERYRVRDENGNMQWRQDTPPEIRAQAEAHERYIEQWAERLVREPDKVLPEIMQKEFDRLFEERFSERLTQQQQEQRLRQIQQENSNWLYEKDPRSGQIARDANGQFRLTPAGQAALHFVQEAESMNIRNPDHQWTYALRSLQAYANQNAPVQPKPDKRMDHLQRHSANPPNRDGSAETPEQPLQRRQNPNQSPGASLVELMQASGDL